MLHALLLLGCIVMFGALRYEIRAKKGLTREVAELREQLSAEQSTTQKSSSGGPRTDQDALNLAERQELLKLRAEVTELHNTLAKSQSASRSAPAPLPIATRNVNTELPTDLRLKELAASASSGDTNALRELQTFATGALKLFRTNSVDGEAQMAHLREAFKSIGEAAGNGDEKAFKALWQATHMEHLGGLAMLGLESAAMKGNHDALEILLKPGEFGLDAATSVGYLVPIAVSGEPRAIQVMISAAYKNTQQGNWGFAVDGLQNSAERGDVPSLEALAFMAQNAKNEDIRRRARNGLEKGVMNNSQRAFELLQQLPPVK